MRVQLRQRFSSQVSGPPGRGATNSQIAVGRQHGGDDAGQVLQRERRNLSEGGGADRASRLREAVKQFEIARIIRQIGVQRADRGPRGQFALQTIERGLDLGVYRRQIPRLARRRPAGDDDQPQTFAEGAADAKAVLHSIAAVHAGEAVDLATPIVAGTEQLRQRRLQQRCGRQQRVADRRQKPFQQSSVRLPG